RRRIPFPPELVQMCGVVENSIGRPNHGQSVTLRIPRESKARRKMLPVIRYESVSVWNPSLALKIDSCRSLGVYRAHNTLIKTRLIEERFFSGCIVRSPVGLPSQAGVHRQLRSGLPGVLQVQANIVLPEILVRDPALCITVRSSRHQIGEAK